MKHQAYKIYDNKEKTWVNDIHGMDMAFPTLVEAEAYKEKLLDSGDYPDDPHTVYDVRAVEITNLTTGI